MSLPAGAQSVVWDGRLPHGTPRLRRPLRRARLRHELGRHVRSRRSVFLQARELESRGDFVARALRRDRRLLPDDDRRRVPGGQRARDGLRRRARLGRAHARVRRARLARDRARAPTSPSCSPACSGTRSARSAAGGSATGRRAVRRAPRPLVPPLRARLERAERWFARWNDWAVFVGRVTPGRPLVRLDPGRRLRSPFRRYNVLTLAGNSIWCLVLAAIGWALGSNWDTFHKDFRWVEYAVVVGILGAAAYLVLRRRRTATIAPADDDSPR